MNKSYKLRIINLFCFLVILISSCKKFVEVDPPRTSLIKSTVFASDAAATAATVDVYYQMSSSGFASGGVSSITFFSALSSDEQVSYYVSLPQLTEEYVQFNENRLFATNSNVAILWSDIYNCIFKVNAIIEGLSSSSGVSESIKNQLSGEAKFIRAFCYFYLVNLWGDVPLVLTTDYLVNNSIPRTSQSQVYEQIIVDLKDAQNLLQDDFSFSNNERVRANKGAATALLARVNLYIQDWVNAEAEATNIIDNPDRYSLASSLDDVFKKNSNEAIWQFSTISVFPNDLLTFMNFGSLRNSAFRDSFVNNFEIGDNRRTSWIGSISVGGVSYYHSTKYKLNPSADYSTVIRLAELYLIRAEARAKQGKIVGINSAESDINIIRNRAGIGNTSANTQPAMLVAIEQERKVELFAEWGHRWLDLKRTGRATSVLNPIKPSWQAYKELYPIPEVQLTNNASVTQNSGY